MNRILSNTIALLALVCILGCQTPLRTTYIATGTVKTTIDTAYMAWRDYVAAGHATRAQDEKAQELYTQYLRAMKVAGEVIMAAQTNPGAVDESKFKQVLEAVSNSSADLIAFITPFLKKD